MVQTVSGFYGTVEAPGEAGRFHRLAPPRVRAAGQFPATSSGTRTVALGAGTLLCCGIMLVETASVSTALPANTSGANRYDVVGYRFTWSPTGGTVSLFSKQGTSSTLPVLDRRPGIVYEMPLVGVLVRSGVTTISSGDLFDIRPRGGFGGGAFMIDHTTFMNALDLPQGSYLTIGTNLLQAWTVDGNGNTSFLYLSQTSGPWQAFTPTLRANGNVVTLGPGSALIGRYQVLDGTCRIKVQINRGSSGNVWPSGPFSIDLPVLAAATPLDQWINGRLYTTVGGAMEWPIKALVRRDIGQRANVYAPTAANDMRMLPAGYVQGGGPGAGIPYIAGSPTELSTMQLQGEYLI